MQRACGGQVYLHLRTCESRATLQVDGTTSSSRTRLGSGRDTVRMFCRPTLKTIS
jgi:hypothetical protein